jgi:hypothetical protein
MGAPATAAASLSPLGLLAPKDRAKVIATISSDLPRAEAVTVLTALAGSREEVLALQWTLQRRVQELLLRAFPPGQNALIVSRLALALVPTDQWLPEIEDELNAGSVDDAIATLKGWAKEPSPPERENR